MMGHDHLFRAGVPCPFCGSVVQYWDSVRIDDDDEHFIVCRGCGCEGPYDQDKETALIKWNTRSN